jgi:predicted DCC family thiol-disulfide oxidoreductase YuxK
MRNLDGVSASVECLFKVETLFYDGHCGLCHRTVQFVLKHDPEGRHFRFAPLQGQTFKSRVSEDRRASLPDSMVVETLDGSLLLRSDAWMHMLRRLEAGWRIIASVKSVFPRAVRDFAYDLIASVRYRIFRRREDVCPLVPADLRVRFDP